jgi:iron(III) transport system substrate-binding protein
MRKFLIVPLLFVLMVTSLHAAPLKQTQVVNVYSARTYGAMEQAFVNFTEETGIEVRVSQGSVQSLIERLRAEGEQTPADVFFSIDAGTLDLAAEEGLLQSVESEILTDAIPEAYRDEENRWFGVSQRIRTIMYNPETVDPSELSTYEALGDEQWNGRLCLRPATHIYTISLTASLVAAYGEEEAQEIVEGWVNNNPQYIDSDTEILNTIAAGGCDVGLTNHYYLARLKNEDPEFPVELFWANQGEDERGVFRNISGAGVTSAAVNYDNAVAFIEWMATTGQAGDETGIPGGNFEFPVAEDAELNEVIATFGDFSEITVDPLPLGEYGDYQAAAVTVLENAGYGF